MSMPISFRRVCSIALLPMVFGACSDALSPTPAIDVSLRVSDQQGPLAVTFEGTSAQGLLCDVTFEARGLGRNAHAIWQDGSVLFYTRPNRGIPFDSVLVSANDVRLTFSADTIGPGQIEHTRWLFAIPEAYEIAMSLRYQVDPGGAVKTASAHFTCGRSLSPSMVQPPPIGAIAVQPQRVDIKAF